MIFSYQVYIKFQKFGISFKLAGAEGIEPPTTVLETAIIPFNYAPIFHFMKSNFIISIILILINMSHLIFKELSKLIKFNQTQYIDLIQLLIQFLFSIVN